jgi:hypothetical protein
MKKKDLLISLAIIAVSGGFLYFYTRRTGYIQLDASGVDARLQLRSSLLGKTTIRSDREPVAVRARIHRPQYLTLSIDYKGRSCLMNSRGPWGEYAKIGVESKKTTVVKIGPPFLIQPAIRKNGSCIQLRDFSIIGRAGEKYQYGNWASTPKIKIIDEKGNILASGNFKFG